MLINPSQQVTLILAQATSGLLQADFTVAFYKAGVIVTPAFVITELGSSGSYTLVFSVDASLVDWQINASITADTGYYWQENIQVTALLDDASFTRKALKNRIVRNATTGVTTIYDDDDTTVLWVGTSDLTTLREED